MAGSHDAPDAGAAAGAEGGGTPPSTRPSSRQDVLHKLLIAELATLRGELSLSLDHYLEVARTTRDAGVTARAAGLAVAAGARDEALEAARLWSEVEPSSVEARMMLASLRLGAGDIEGTVESLKVVVELLPAGAGFHHAADLLAAEKNVEAAVTAMRELVRPHENDATAQLALARLLSRTGRMEEAADAAGRAHALAPDNARAAILRARLLQHLDDIDGALDLLAAFLDRVPDATAARMARARILMDVDRREEARVALDRLVADEPGNDDARYALTLLLMQMDRTGEAERHLETLAESGSRRDVASYHLGRIAEEQQRIDDAIASYRRVLRGEHRLNARIRIAMLLADRGELEAAQRHLHGVRRNSVQEAVRVYAVEADLLTRAERLDEAMAVYDAALAEFPEHSDLLYARGMLAVSMDRLDILERDMRDILSREPDNANALNALGYTLADRTDRYEEAYALIKRAVELKPDDHYIADSLGWVLYRLERYEEALVELRRAMSIRPDPEIAAHLGEVLWVLGKEAEAREVWDTALEAAPDDERLLDTIERFGP